MFKVEKPQHLTLNLPHFNLICKEKLDCLMPFKMTKSYQAIPTPIYLLTHGPNLRCGVQTKGGICIMALTFGWYTYYSTSTTSSIYAARSTALGLWLGSGAETS